MAEGMSKERANTTIDLLTAVIVDELARSMHADRDKALADFLMSDTGKLLYDESSKLWWRGPSDIASIYASEIAGR